MYLCKLGCRGKVNAPATTYYVQVKAGHKSKLISINHAFATIIVDAQRVLIKRETFESNFINLESEDTTCTITQTKKS